MQIGGAVSTDLFLPNLDENAGDMDESGVRGVVGSPCLSGESSTVAVSVLSFMNGHRVASGSELGLVRGDGWRFVTHVKRDFVNLRRSGCYCFASCAGGGRMDGVQDRKMSVGVRLILFYKALQFLVQPSFDW